jgi:hypothetical protein
MDRQEPLSLPHTFKSTHGPLPVDLHRKLSQNG